MFHKRRALDPTWPKQWFDHKPVLWRVAECVPRRESVAGVFKNDKEISGNKDQVSRKVHCQQVLEQSSIPPSNSCHNPDHHTMSKFSFYTKYARPPLILYTFNGNCSTTPGQTAKQHRSTAVQVSKPTQSESMEAAPGRSWISLNSMWSSFFFRYFRCPSFLTGWVWWLSFFDVQLMYSIEALQTLPTCCRWWKKTSL